MKPEPRAEPYPDKDQRRSSNHTSGAAAQEETRNEEDRAKPHYVYRPESCRKQAVVTTSQQTTVSCSMSEEQSHGTQVIVSHSPHKTVTFKDNHSIKDTTTDKINTISTIKYVNGARKRIGNELSLGDKLRHIKERGVGTNKRHRPRDSLQFTNPFGNGQGH